MIKKINLKKILKFVIIKTTLIIFFFSNVIYSKEIIAEYTVSASGIKIGNFSWFLKMDDDAYETKISLKNSGFLSAIYRFNGEYISNGGVEDRYLKPRYYRQYWETKKKSKIIEMYFDEKLIGLNQIPVEKEVARLDLKNLFEYYDPIASFINILIGSDAVKVVDGRRMYTLQKNDFNKNEGFVLEIINYKNIWADHERNDLESIYFELSDESFMPETINIRFKDRNFKLEKN